MELTAKIRTIRGKKVKTLRKKDIIPAILYGHKIKPQLLQINYLDFIEVYNQVGKSTLIDLKIDHESPAKVLIHQLEKNYLTDKISHIDFYQVKKGEKITAEIELEFIGESKAIKELEGILVKNLTKIKVECLPADLVHTIKVDISQLSTFDDLIKVKDLPLPQKIKVLEKEDEVVASVTSPRKEEKVEEKPEEKVEAQEAIQEKKEEIATKEAPKEKSKG